MHFEQITLSAARIEIERACAVKGLIMDPKDGWIDVWGRMNERNNACAQHAALLCRQPAEI